MMIVLHLHPCKQKLKKERTKAKQLQQNVILSIIYEYTSHYLISHYSLLEFWDPFLQPYV